MKKNINPNGIYIILIISCMIFSKCYTQSEIRPKKEPKDINKQTESANDKLETEVRLYLYDKYHPGTCYGMPQVIDNKIVERTLRNNSDMVKIIREKYNPKRDFEAYEILNSINSIMIKNNIEGYEFSFRDGNCCTVTSYEGILYVVNNRIVNSKILKKETEDVPC